MRERTRHYVPLDGTKHYDLCSSLACLQQESSYNLIRSLDSATNLQEIQRKMLNHEDAITKIHILRKSWRQVSSMTKPQGV